MLEISYEPAAFWSEPGSDYFVAAMEQLGIEDWDLEEVSPNVRNVPIGDYPVLDQVYAKAWELREADGE